MQTWMSYKHWVMVFCLSALILLLFACQKNKVDLPSIIEHKTVIQPIDWSNIAVDKVIVYKAKRELQLLQHGQVIKSYKMRLGFNPVGHKLMEGDGKTPEGIYTLDWRNPESKFYKSLHISYPNAQDQAQAKSRNVSAGGDIMIHGSANYLGAEKGSLFYAYLPQGDWTQGCIAVSNQDMDELWHQIKDHTVIEILP